MALCEEANKLFSVYSKQTFLHKPHHELCLVSAGRSLQVEDGKKVETGSTILCQTTLTFALHSNYIYMHTKKQVTAGNPVMQETLLTVVVDTRCCFLIAQMCLNFLNCHLFSGGNKLIYTSVLVLRTLHVIVFIQSCLKTTATGETSCIVCAHFFPAARTPNAKAFIKWLPFKSL